MTEDLKLRGRPTRHATKRAMELLLDGKPRSAADLARDLGIDEASAYEAIRSLSKQRMACIHETVFIYRISAAGLERSEAQKKAKARAEAKWAEKEKAAIDRVKDKIKRKRERELQRRRESRALAREVEAEGDEIAPEELARMAEETVRGAKMALHPLHAAWGAVLEAA